jgi:hypothetical protein
MIDEQVLLERIQRIEASQYRTEAMLRTLIRDLNYVPDMPQPANLTIIKPTH